MQQRLGIIPFQQPFQIPQKWEHCILGMAIFLISVTMMTIIAAKENQRHKKKIKKKIKKKGNPKYHMADRRKNLTTGNPLFHEEKISSLKLN